MSALFTALLLSALPAPRLAAAGAAGGRVVASVSMGTSVPVPWKRTWLRVRVAR